MMPLLWHQCLGAFAQHYKAELTNEQKERFKMLLRVQEHGLVTPDIRRELFSGRSRGDPYRRRSPAAAPTWCSARRERWDRDV